MHKIKNWMCKDDWFFENNNQLIKEFVSKTFILEDPVQVNNPKEMIAIDFTSLKCHDRIVKADEIMTKLFGDNEFFLCEYGSIGISEKNELIKGHAQKENCFEFQTMDQDGDSFYLYDNITYLRVIPHTFRFKKYLRLVIKGYYFSKEAYLNQYYFLDLKHKTAARIYDGRGMVIVSKDKDLLGELAHRYRNILDQYYLSSMQEHLAYHSAV